TRRRPRTPTPSPSTTLFRSRAAAPAHEVVVVVTGAPLIPGRTASRLDLPGQPAPGKRAEHVVHGLSGDRIQPRPHPSRDLVHFQVATLTEHLEHGHPRPCDAQAMLTEQFFG